MSHEYLVKSGDEEKWGFGWFLAYNSEEEENHIEAFMAESWADYLRQVERMTNADHTIEEQVRTFHQGSEAPAVTTLIAEHPHWRSGNLILSSLPGNNK